MEPGYFTESDSAEVVIARNAAAKSERLAQVMAVLTRHIHAAVKEIEPTTEEWMTALQFLTATGQMCSDWRQEYILFSDVMGVSMLVDAVNHPKGGVGTESTVLGPFFVPGAPQAEFGADIRRRHLDEAVPCLVTGKVTDQAGQPLAGATLEVWQTAANGFYDVQDTSAPQWNLRGCFTTNSQGEYALVTEKPVSYPVPTDGPVGRLLDAAGRHAFRPAHLHFMVKADGFETLVTHVFVNDDPYLDSDAVFATKESLLGEFSMSNDAAEAGRFALPTPHARLSFDFGLMRAAL